LGKKKKYRRVGMWLRLGSEEGKGGGEEGGLGRAEEGGLGLGL